MATKRGITAGKFSGCDSQMGLSVCRLRGAIVSQ
jgi:hypothetical protein